MRDARTSTSIPQFGRTQAPSDLEHIASLIGSANERLSTVRNYVCLYLDMALTAAGSSKSVQLDAAAIGEVLLDFMAQLENSIEELSDARSLTEVIDDQLLENV